MATANTRSTFSEFKDQCISRRYITVRGQYDGFHAYEDAPEQVAFLKAMHRHLFKWEASIEVFHDDRELEFFMVQESINRTIIPFLRLQHNLGSCEQQAEIILEGLVNNYGAKRRYIVTVSEDGESDGTVIWQHTS